MTMYLFKGYIYVPFTMHISLCTPFLWKGTFWYSAGYMFVPLLAHLWNLYLKVLNCTRTVPLFLRVYERCTSARDLPMTGEKGIPHLIIKKMHYYVKNRIVEIFLKNNSKKHPTCISSKCPCPNSQTGN